MALKRNSQKLLLFLYHPDSVEISRSYDLVSKLLPGLSGAGRRSLVSHLESQGLIYRTQVLNQKLLSLTNEGRRAVEACFECFSDRRRQWQGQTKVLVFLSSPKQDQAFRYLRNLLTTEFAIMLRQGVYLLIGDMPTNLETELQQTYRNHVLVLGIENWLFGTQRDLLIRELNIPDLIEHLSGISNQIDGLLEKITPFSDRTDQQKDQIFSVFDRFLEIASLDIGIEAYYFPESPTAVRVLVKFQSLFN